MSENGIVFRMEDGTLPFLDIIALNHGFDVIQSLAGGMGPISRRTFSLARYTWFHLKQLRHVNGMPVVELYCDGDFKDSQNQGPLVAFNLKNSDGNVIGFATIEKVAESFNMQLRSGCFCNTGACQKYLGLTSDDLIANFHVRPFLQSPNPQNNLNLLKII
jgi:molybdenum cofactor sulfurtransferase